MEYRIGFTRFSFSSSDIRPLAVRDLCIIWIPQEMKSNKDE